MNPHPFFNLLIHTDQELESVLGESIRERQTLHEWPLSCVQRLVLESGQNWIYKTQSAPTVEPFFYQRARSPLLTTFRTIYWDARYACMLLKDIQSPRLSDLQLGAEEVLAAGRKIVGMIQNIAGNPPVYLDISTSRRWKALMESMLASQRTLIAQGIFVEVNKDMAEHAFEQSMERDVHRILTGPVGLVHLDLTGDNVFRLPDGFRVIDWQRPIRGPVEIDLAVLLESLGIAFPAIFQDAIWTVITLLRIHWLTHCAKIWFPEGQAAYDQQIAEMIRSLPG